MHPFPFWNYARALFELSGESGFDGVDKSLSFIEKIFAQHDQLHVMMNNPQVSYEKKAALISMLADSQVDAVTLKLLYIIIKMRKTKYFPMIAGRFRDFVHEKRNELCAQAASAEQLSDDEVSGIKRILEKIYSGKKILVETKIKPEFIGGMRISLGDQRYDYSISGYLQKLRNEII